MKLEPRTDCRAHALSAKLMLPLVYTMGPWAGGKPWQGRQEDAQAGLVRGLVTNGVAVGGPSPD